MTVAAVAPQNDDRTTSAARTGPFAAAKDLVRVLRGPPLGVLKSRFHTSNRLDSLARRDEDVAISGAVRPLRNEQPELAARLVQ